MAPDCPDDPLRIRFCGLDFANPVVLLSGCVGFGEEYTRVAGFSNRDVGAICLKGTTATARLGNAPHRIWETTGGMLNAIGLQNPGVEAVVRDILPTLDFSETRFIANVSGSTVEVTTRACHLGAMATRLLPSDNSMMSVCLRRKATSSA